METLATIHNLISKCAEPYIELGGPTPEGYEFINALGLQLPKNITVTNISNPIIINPFGPDPKSYPVDATVDITNLPYKNNSIGMFIVSSPPLQINSANNSQQPALVEYELPDIQNIDVNKLTNLRILLFINTAKALRKNGLLVFQNIRPQDSQVAKKLGFKPLLSGKIEAKYSSQIYQLA